MIAVLFWFVEWVVAPTALVVMILIDAVLESDPWLRKVESKEVRELIHEWRGVNR